MSQNVGVEPPIYIEAFGQQRRHWYTATNGDAVHRFPVRLQNIWNQYDMIPDVPDPALLTDGDTAGVVELRQSRPLEPIPGAAHKFRLAPPALVGDLFGVVTATTGLAAPIAGSAAPTLTGSPATGYTPVLVDAAGGVFPMQAAVWVVDGLNHFVEFPYGVPAAMVPPLALTYFRYVGTTGGGGAGPGQSAWHYMADASGSTLSPDPAFLGAASPSDWVAPLPAQSTEGAGTRIMIDQSKGAVRGGTVSGAQWDDALRGVGSTAFGVDTTASGASSFAIGDTATAAFANSFVWADATARSATAASEATFGAAGGFRVFGAGAPGAPAYAGGEIYLDAADTVVTGELAVTGLVVDPPGLVLSEGGAVPGGPPAAGDGTLWLRSVAPNTLMFTDDAGTDFIVAGAGTNPWEVTATLVRLDTVTTAGTEDLVFPVQSTEGASTRLLFDAGSGAFRAGTVAGAQWDAAARGVASVAFGTDTTASGANSFAAGLSSTATHANALVWSDATPRASTAGSETTFGAAGGFRVFGAGAPGTPAYAGGEIYLDAADTVVTGKLTVTGLIDPTGLVLAEQAAVPGGAPAAGDGTLWVQNVAPNTLMFTDDAGTDFIVAGAGTNPWEVTATLIRLDTVTTTGTEDLVFPVQSTEGASTRMLFDAGSGAFRAGTVTGAQWDAVSRGAASAAFGTDTTASGVNSFAAGDTATAAFANSFVWADATARSATAASEATFGAAGGFRVFGAGAPGTPAYAGGEIYLDAADTVVTGKLTVTGLIDPTGLVLAEQAAVPGGAPAAGDGTLWLRNLAPNVLMFTDDAGTDFTVAGAGANPWEVTATLVRLDTVTTAGTEDLVFPAQSTEGASTRLLFDAGNGAFRAGTVAATQWDAVSRGAASVAFGTDTTASGAGSFAVGLTCVASGAQSFALGTTSTASGNTSFAAGNACIASGNLSYALGSSAAASGVGAFAQGIANTAAGALSFIGGGFQNTISAAGLGSFAAGFQTTVAHANAFVWSDATPRSSTAANETTFGAAGGFRVFGAGAPGTPAYAGGEIYLDAADTVITGKLTVTGLIDPTGLVLAEQAAVPGGAPAAGDGTLWLRNAAPNVLMFTDDAGTDFAVAGAGSNPWEVTATLVRLDTVTTAGTEDLVFPVQSTEGASTRLMFDAGSGAFRAGTVTGPQWDAASRGAASTAFGTNTTALGVSSFAAGNDCTAVGAQSTALGLSCLAGGINSFAAGNACNATGVRSFAMGDTSTASGTDSFALGLAAAAFANSFVWGDSSTRSATAADEVTFGAAGGFRVFGAGAPGTPAYAGGEIYLDAADTVVTGTLAVTGTLDAADTVITGKLTVTGLIDPTGLVLVEQAAVPGGAPAAGDGTLWLRNLAPNVLMFTDDAGTDFAVAGAGSNPWEVTATLVRLDTVTTAGTEDLVFPAQSTEGASTRLLFDAGNGAFRAGTVTGTQWNSINRGAASAAFGTDTQAPNVDSFCTGHLNVASGPQSAVVGGESNAAVGTMAGCLAGIMNSANGQESACLGGNTNVASGLRAVCLGGNVCTASANASATIGVGCLASGIVSQAVGQNASVIHPNSFVFGDGVATSSINLQSWTVRCRGGARFLSSAGSVGVQLIGSSSSWSALCDEAVKQNVDPLDGRETCAILEAVPIARWEYQEAPGRANIGPMAQAWHAAFPSTKDPLRIEMLDLVGVALSAAKGCYAHIKRLQDQRLESAELLRKRAAPPANLHAGSVVLDASGGADVAVSASFVAAGGAPGYQLTPVGQQMPALHVSAGLFGGVFSIAGGAPAGTVSWQVTSAVDA